MSFFPYFVCVLLGVDSLQGGLAEGNRIFPQVWVKAVGGVIITPHSCVW